MIGGPSKPKAPPPPPSTPTRAQASAFSLQTPEAQRVGSSLVNTTPLGLLRRAKTEKRSLIGGTT